MKRFIAVCLLCVGCLPAPSTSVQSPPPPAPAVEPESPKLPRFQASQIAEASWNLTPGDYIEIEGDAYSVTRMNDDISGPYGVVFVPRGGIDRNAVITCSERWTSHQISKLYKSEDPPKKIVVRCRFARSSPPRYEFDQSEIIGY